MGYSTDFDGEVTIQGNVTDAQVEYINKLANTRRMKRDPQVLFNQHKGEYGKYGSKPTDSPEDIYGVDGEFFVGDDSAGVLDVNRPSKNQPGLWLQWIIEDSDGDWVVKWDQGEKFYNYEEWLNYLIETFFIPWGWTLNGNIEWSGEESGDLGMIIIIDNVLTTKHGSVSYE